MPVTCIQPCYSSLIRGGRDSKVLMEALLILLLSYRIYPISIYLLVGQQDLQVALACRWPAKINRCAAYLQQSGRSSDKTIERPKSSTSVKAPAAGGMDEKEPTLLIPDLFTRHRQLFFWLIIGYHMGIEKYKYPNTAIG